MTDQILASGSASGPLVELTAPLSLWGGFDPGTGQIVDRSHPQCGTVLTGAIVVMPSGRGSSSSSAVLAEAMRVETAPAAFILTEPDGILAVGAHVGSMLYGVHCPIVVTAVPPSG
ncbi:MAG: aconitase X swivel domain-containing protein, partial [Acidimicrobiia bacterium]